MKVLFVALLFAALLILTWDRSLKSRFTTEEPAASPEPSVTILAAATPKPPKVPFFADPKYSPALKTDSLPPVPGQKAR